MESTQNASTHANFHRTLPSRTVYCGGLLLDKVGFIREINKERVM